MSKLKGTSRDKKDWLGNASVEHRDGLNQFSGTTKVKTTLLGQSHQEHRNAKGDVVGTSKQRRTIFGDSFTEHRDGSGRVTGKSQKKKDIHGNDITQHYDASGQVVGYSKVEKDIFGRKVTKHYQGAPAGMAGLIALALFAIFIVSPFVVYGAVSWAIFGLFATRGAKLLTRSNFWRNKVPEGSFIWRNIRFMRPAVASNLNAENWREYIAAHDVNARNSRAVRYTSLLFGERLGRRREGILMGLSLCGFFFVSTVVLFMVSGELNARTATWPLVLGLLGAAKLEAVVVPYAMGLCFWIGGTMVTKKLLFKTGVEPETKAPEGLADYENLSLEEIAESLETRDRNVVTWVRAMEVASSNRSAVFEACDYFEPLPHVSDPERSFWNKTVDLRRLPISPHAGQTYMTEADSYLSALSEDKTLGPALQLLNQTGAMPDEGLIAWVGAAVLTNQRLILKAESLLVIPLENLRRYELAGAFNVEWEGLDGEESQTLIGVLLRPDIVQWCMQNVEDLNTNHGESSEFNPLFLPENSLQNFLRVMHA